LGDEIVIYITKSEDVVAFKGHVLLRGDFPALKTKGGGGKLVGQV